MLTASAQGVATAATAPPVRGPAVAGVALSTVCQVCTSKHTYADTRGRVVQSVACWVCTKTCSRRRKRQQGERCAQVHACADTRGSMVLRKHTRTCRRKGQQGERCAQIHVRADTRGSVMPRKHTRTSRRKRQQGEKLQRRAWRAFLLARLPLHLLVQKVWMQLERGVCVRVCARVY